MHLQSRTPTGKPRRTNGSPCEYSLCRFRKSQRCPQSTSRPHERIREGTFVDNHRFDESKNTSLEQSSNKSKSKEETTPPPLQEQQVIQQAQIQPTKAFEIVAGLQLDSFWDANPEAALNRTMFTDLFKAFGNHVSLNQISQDEAVRVAEQQAILEQQAKETREVALKVANEAAAKEQEVVRVQELQMLQIAAEHGRVAEARARDLKAHQVIEQQKLLAKQTEGAAASSTLDPTKVEPLAVAAQVSPVELSETKGAGKTASVIEKIERQLNQTSKDIEPDLKTSDGMELDKAEEQDAKQTKVDP